MFANCITATRNNKSLPIRDGQSLDANGRSPASAKPRRTWDSLSREAQALLTKLASHNTGPMGARSNPRLQGTIYESTAITATAGADSSVAGRGQFDGGRNLGNA